MGEGRALINLGAMNQSLGQYPKALEYDQQALAIFQEFGDRAGEGHALNNLGNVYGSLGQHAKALEHFQQALAIDREIGDRAGKGAVLTNLGIEYRSLGQYPQALEHYQQALAIGTAVGSPEQLWRTWSGLGATYAVLGQIEPAIFCGKQAVNTIQAMRGQLTALEKELQKSFLVDKESVYRDLADRLIDQRRLPEAQQVLAMLKEEEYFDFIRRRTARAGELATTASYTAEERPWAERYGQISAKLVSLGRQYEDLRGREKLGLNAEEKAHLDRLDADMRVAREAFRGYLKELETAFLAQGTERAKEFGEKELRALKQVQAELKPLGPGVVLIHYLMTDDRLRLLLTTPEQQLHRDSPITAKDLNRLIAAFSEALQDPRSDPLKPAQALYRHLLGPLEEDLRQAEARTLLLALDDTLRYLPFAALHDGKQYIAERYGIVVYTAATRSHLATAPQSHWRVAGLGVSEGSGEFVALPAVKRELMSIVHEQGCSDPPGVLPGMVRLDRDFTSGHLSDALRDGYPVVHVASHFVFRPGTETDSFLVLGAGQKHTLADLQDGDYPLTAVDLLTLSACETAMSGRDAHGREIEGFGTLAQQQGAKAVLATLWPVADLSTAAFMEGFYRRHQQGMTKAEALRRTQVAFLRGEAGAATDEGGSEDRGQVLTFSGKSRAEQPAGPPYAHPYYWAPFILMGNGL